MTTETELKKEIKLKVLIACEESQEVCLAWRILGHNAWSCDILPCSGGHPEWHIQDDVRNWLGKNKYNNFQGWDLIIAFPLCTHLAVSGAKYFAKKIADGRQQEGIDFFMLFVNADCPRKAIENPIGIMSSRYRKPDQIIQPWMFGHGETKATSLWLFGLPKLKPTNIVEGREARIHKMPPGKERSKLRSKTYPGIAKAMATQWSEFILNKSGIPSEIKEIK